MRTELFWIEGCCPGRLAIAPRPRGGDWLEDELRSWKQSGVMTVVSLLTPDERAQLNLTQESRLCDAEDMRYVSFPIPDRGRPSDREAFRSLVTELSERLRGGDGVAVHCRQGIGRAAVVAIAVLLSLGVAADEAVRRVAAARGRPVPETDEQRTFLTEFARSARPLSDANVRP